MNYFYDVRTFGAVMSTGSNAGQVRGLYRLLLEEAWIQYCLLIYRLRMAVTDSVKGKN